MVIIQPVLLVDMEKQAEALKYAIRSICYELNAPKEEVRGRSVGGERGQARVFYLFIFGEGGHGCSLTLLPSTRHTLLCAPAAVCVRAQVVHLILNNQSVLHGREMRLSVADIAHLSMMQDKKREGGRIVD